MLKVYTPHINERIRYALDLVLSQVGEIPFEVVQDTAEISSGDRVVNYSGERINGAFQVHPAGLLFEKNIQDQDIPFAYRQDEFLVSVFPTEFDQLGFDIFSASFYFATRYEEYRKSELDQHGRFLAKQSLAKKIGVIRRPIINIWVKALKEALSSFFNVGFPSQRKFTITQTIDVDNAWEYKHKGGLKSIGSIGKSAMKMDFVALKDKTRVMRGIEDDRFDQFDYLVDQQKKNGVEAIYFWLLGDYKKPYDTNISHTNSSLKELIKSLSKVARMGIHPSYASYLNVAKVKKEMNRLKAIIHEEQEVLNRQHFLKLSVPDSYRIMEELGVTADYTMGYAEQTGFRAGLCTPFKLFDLLQNKVLAVTIHPFAYMDGTLAEYLKFTPEEGLKEVEFLKKQVKEVSGEFIGIWHNSSVTDEGVWKGWRKVFEEGLRKG